MNLVIIEIKSISFKFLKSIPYSQKNFLLDIIENTDFIENIKEKYVRVSGCVGCAYSCQVNRD